MSDLTVPVVFVAVVGCVAHVKNMLVFVTLVS